MNELTPQTSGARLALMWAFQICRVFFLWCLIPI